MNSRTLGTVDLDDDCISKTIDIIQEELNIPSMDLEQRESLERVVMMSIAFYLMYRREAYNKSTKLNQ